MDLVRKWWARLRAAWTALRGSAPAYPEIRPVAGCFVVLNGVTTPLEPGEFELTETGDWLALGPSNDDEAWPYVAGANAWDILVDAVSAEHERAGEAPKVLYASAAVEDVLGAWLVNNGHVRGGTKLAAVRSHCPTVLGMDVVWDSSRFALSHDPLPAGLERPVSYGSLPRPVSEEPGFGLLLKRIEDAAAGTDPAVPAGRYGRLYLTSEAEHVLTLKAASVGLLAGDAPPAVARAVLPALLARECVFDSPRFGSASRPLPADLPRPITYAAVPPPEPRPVPAMELAAVELGAYPILDPGLSTERPPTQSLSPAVADQVRRARPAPPSSIVRHVYARPGAVPAAPGGE